MEAGTGAAAARPGTDAPECVICGTALAGPLGAVFRLVGIGRSARNPNLCNRCNTHVEEGRVVELTVVFAVQVLLFTSGPLASPPVELESVQLSIEIAAEPSVPAMDAWRLHTYQAIQAAYAAQLDAWQSQGDVDGAASSPVVQPRFGWRAIERRELQRGALDLLFQTLHERTGDDENPSGTPRGIDFAQPRQLQFFERSFEWRELSFRFIQGGRPRQRRGGRAAAGVGAVGDERFLEFLEADWAQLLIPVSPCEAMAVLYFLASGMLWDGEAAWIPAHDADVALVCEMKKLRPGPRELRRLGEPWEVVVPTTISVLQDGEGTVAELCAPPTTRRGER